MQNKKILLILSTIMAGVAILQNFNNASANNMQEDISKC